MENLSDTIETQKSNQNLSASLISRDTLIQNTHLKQVQIHQPIVQQQIKPQTKPNVRLDSLDVYRGFTMFGMVIVDCGGMNMPSYLQHAQWIGLTPADLIFPSFLFIMGMAVPLAVSTTKPMNFKKILRVIALFGVGLFMNFMDARMNYQKTRILGVLQRLAICYGVILLIHFLTGYGKVQKRIFGFLAVLSGFLIYISYMVSYDHPQLGCPKQIKFTKECNFAAYFDRKIISKQHQLRYPNDPQGLFTTLSAIVTTYFGYYFCLIMKDNKNQIKKTLKRWLIICILLGICVYPMTKVMPFSKRLYSSSFAIITSCVSGFSIFTFVILVDILFKKNKKVNEITSKIIQPFIWLGRNPLFVYFSMTNMELVMGTYFRWDGQKGWQAFQIHFFQSWLGQTQLASVLFAVFFLLIQILISWLLYRKNIFIRV